MALRNASTPDAAHVIKISNFSPVLNLDDDSDDESDESEFALMGTTRGASPPFSSMAAFADAVKACACARRRRGACCVCERVRARVRARADVRHAWGVRVQDGGVQSQGEGKPLAKMWDEGDFVLPTVGCSGDDAGDAKGEN